MKYSKVYLIHPDYPGSFYFTPNWPIGLGYIAEALKNNDIEYRVSDLRFPEKRRTLIQDISIFAPDLIALSLMTSKYKHHYSLIDKLGEAFPEIKITAGGPHISLLKEKVLYDCLRIDFGITLEGEETIVELCKGREESKTEGLIYRENGEVRYTGDRQYIKDIDSIDFPVYGGFEAERYDAKSINLVSSRGCPYQCIYCCVKLVSGQKWRARSPQSLLKEIEFFYKRGYRIFNFNDDCFNLDKKRVYAICDEIEKRNLTIELNCPNGIRADRVDKPLLKRMRETGFRHLAFGVEAGNNKVLRNIKKGETIQDIENGIKHAVELEYDVELFFLIGSPGEEERDIEDSFRLALKYPLKDVRFYNLIPFPNTELYDWIENNDYFNPHMDDYLNGNLMWVNEPIFRTPELSFSQRKDIYKRGLTLGNRLRKKYRYKYYLDSFRKAGFLAYPVSFIASSDMFQQLLKRVGFLQNVRFFLKKIGFFERQITNG